MDNAIWGGTLIDALAANGVTRLVASPGSRSTPLTLAALRHPDIEVHMVLDERSAAFFALGLARRPRFGMAESVALVATSGSAPAHWLPAVIEAGMSRVPLILLSADRPDELQGCGANQTVDQRALFGSHVRAFHQLPHADTSEEGLRHLRWLTAHALEQSRWPSPGPVHLNVPLREPLVGEGAVETSPPLPPFAPPRLLPADESMERLAATLAGERGVIVCGDVPFDPAFPEALTRLAELLDWPILADPLANLRFGPHDRGRVIARYDAFLRNDQLYDQLMPTKVLRFGAQPVSQALARWLDQSGAAQWVVDPFEGRRDPLHRGVEWLRTDPVGFCDELAHWIETPTDAHWLEGFLTAEQQAEEKLEEISIPEVSVIEALRLALPDGALLFSGNSLPIRDLDAFSGGDDKTIQILANRGASGIDGNLSTILGLAAGGEGEVVPPVVGLVGDLAFLHDLNGLMAAPGLDATIVILNNGGGAIFGQLPQARLPEFEKGWLTPHNVDLQRAAELHNLPFDRVEPDELYPVLKQSLARPGVDLIEVIIDREASLAAHRAYWDTVS